MSARKLNYSWLAGALAYVVVMGAGPVLKLAHVGPIGRGSWWWATVLLWGPWVVAMLAWVRLRLSPWSFWSAALPAEMQDVK